MEGVFALYESLHDYLETHENHPRWKRGVYPTSANAEEGFQKGWLYVAEVDGELAGSVIYPHEQGEVYDQVKWPKEIPYDNVYVILTDHSLCRHHIFNKYRKKSIYFLKIANYLECFCKMPISDPLRNSP